LLFVKCTVSLMCKAPVWDYLADWVVLGIYRKINFLSPE